MHCITHVFKINKCIHAINAKANSGIFAMHCSNASFRNTTQQPAGSAVLALLALALKQHALILTQKLRPITASVSEGPSPLKTTMGVFPTWTQSNKPNNVSRTRFIPQVARKTKHTHCLPRRPSVLWGSLVPSNDQSFPPSKVPTRSQTRIWLLRRVSARAGRTSARLAPKTGTKRRLSMLPLWLDLSFCLAFSAVAGKWTCWPLRSAAVPSMCQSQRWRKDKTVGLKNTSTKS